MRLAILLLVLLATAPALAADPEPPEVALCMYITKRTTTLLQQGKKDVAREFQEPLRQCGVILDRALKEEAKRVEPRLREILRGGK